MAHSPWARWLCVNELLMPSEAWYQKSGTRGGEKRNEGAFKKWIDGGMCLGLTRLEHATVVATGSIISHARAAAWTEQPSLIKPSRPNCQTISKRALSVRRSTSKIDTSILNTVRWDGDDSAYILTLRPLSSTIKIHKTDGWQNKQYQHASQLASVCKNCAMTKS